MKIVISLIVSTVIAIFFGIGLQNILGLWEGIALIFGAQILIGFVFNAIKISRTKNIEDYFNNEIEQILQLTEANITCPCNKYKFDERILINMPIEYTCPECNNTFKLVTSVVPTLVTDTANVSQTFETLLERARESSMEKE